MLPKQLSLLPMCQPMEAKLTHRQLPIQLVSFFFELGEMFFIFICAFPTLGFSFNSLGYGWVDLCI